MIGESKDCFSLQCGLPSALEVMGERWSFLILRGAFNGLSHFEQFQGQLERAAIELSRDWRTDKYLRHLEALLIVADANTAFLISGKGDVISSDEGLLSVGSGSMFALAAARALAKHTEMNSADIASESLRIASEICIYTNSEIIVEEL